MQDQRTMNTVIGVIVIVIIAAGGYIAWNRFGNPQTVSAPTTETPAQNAPSANTPSAPVTDNTTPSAVPAPTNSMSVYLGAQNDSGETGLATFMEKDGKTVVSLSLTGAPATQQPAHLHMGTCAKPGAVVFPLTAAVNGKSETTLDVTMDQLKKQLPLILNVHKSATEQGVYVACGEVTGAAAVQQ